MPILEPGLLSRRRLAELLAEARARTVLLVSPVSDDDMHIQPDDPVQPVLRELEQIVQFEHEWLAQGSALNRDDSALPVIESYDDWFDVMMEVRQRSLERLDSVEEPVPLVEYRCRLVLEHEYLRGEALLETLQLHSFYRAPRRIRLPRGRRLADPGVMTRFPGGRIPLGTSSEATAWSDELPARDVDLPPFWIDITPVTNGDFITFMAAGGYVTSDFWSEPGWEWVRASQVQMPRHWFWDDGKWWTRWMDRMMPLDLTCPVACVSCHEAEAFARFAGKRLPSELEWEAAASWDPEIQDRRDYPWGNMPPTPNVANVDQLAFQTAEVGGFPGNISPIGCYGLIGDLWEWTGSTFLPDQGAEPASQAIEPGMRVLRGGSWATRPGAARVTARKAAPMAVRHIFSGFRCAHDA
jgi:iron(II)-dependent oxidoreductase